MSIPTTRLNLRYMGGVPEDWTVARLKFGLSDMGSGGTPDTNTSSYWAEENGTYWTAIGDMSCVDVVNKTTKQLTRGGIESKKLHVWPAGTLLFSMYASLGHTATLAIPATINQALLALLPKAGIVQSFLRYWLLALQPLLKSEASSNTQDNLNAEKVSNLPFAYPSERIQARIVAHLDRATARIDTLVAKKTRFIELLREKRQALITHAVTKGLDPNAPMKDSGIGWLGQVPAHWETLRLANVFREVARAGHPDLPVLSISIHDGISDDELDDAERNRKVILIEDRTKYKKVLPGDLAYNMMRAWQGAFGAVGVIGQVSPAYVVAEPKLPIDTSYVELLLRTPMAVEEMRRFSRGIADFRSRLYWEHFRDVRICLPPHEEQERILSALTERTSRLDTLITKTERSIELLREHRSALITAAVTGKIDLRPAA